MFGEVIHKVTWRCQHVQPASTVHIRKSYTKNRKAVCGRWGQKKIGTTKGTLYYTLRRQNEVVKSGFPSPQPFSLSETTYDRGADGSNLFSLGGCCNPRRQRDGCACFLLSKIKSAYDFAMAETPSCIISLSSTTKLRSPKKEKGKTLW